MNCPGKRALIGGSFKGGNSGAAAPTGAAKNAANSSTAHQHRPSE
jgi:hypothetical protein